MQCSSVAQDDDSCTSLFNSVAVSQGVGEACPLCGQSATCNRYMVAGRASTVVLGHISRLRLCVPWCAFNSWSL
jgi:hypothetical protein